MHVGHKVIAAIAYAAGLWTLALAFAAQEPLMFPLGGILIILVHIWYSLWPQIISVSNDSQARREVIETYRNGMQERRHVKP